MSRVGFNSYTLPCLALVLFESLTPLSYRLHQLSILSTTTSPSLISVTKRLFLCGNNTSSARVRSYQLITSQSLLTCSSSLLHLFAYTLVDKAMSELDWAPKYSMLEGLKDSYENDFKLKKSAGKLDLDFSADDMVLKDDRLDVLMYNAMPLSTV